jgi:hypothetical protein
MRSNFPIKKMGQNATKQGSNFIRPPAKKKPINVSNKVVEPEKEPAGLETDRNIADNFVSPQVAKITAVASGASSPESMLKQTAEFGSLAPESEED